MASITRSELVVGVVVAALSGIIGAGTAYLSTNRQMDVKMVEIAVGILSQEPKENIAPAREWAVDVITYYAAVKPSATVRNALVNYNAVNFWISGMWSKESMLDVLKGVPPAKPDREVIVPPNP